MREKAHERLVMHQPPSNLSADGMDAWYHKQKQRERELRQRRREAEAILRSYRGGGTERSSLGGASTSRDRLSLGGNSMCGSVRDALPEESPYEPEFLHASMNERVMTPMSTMSQVSGSMNDVGHKHRRQLRYDLEKAGREYAEDEKKTDEQIEAQFRSIDTHITIWRNFISSQPGSPFQPEPDRYHLYVPKCDSWNCSTCE